MRGERKGDGRETFGAGCWRASWRSGATGGGASAFIIGERDITGRRPRRRAARWPTAAGAMRPAATETGDAWASGACRSSCSRTTRTVAPIRRASRRMMRTCCSGGRSSTEVITRTRRRGSGRPDCLTARTTGSWATTLAERRRPRRAIGRSARWGAGARGVGEVSEGERGAAGVAACAEAACGAGEAEEGRVARENQVLRRAGLLTLPVQPLTTRGRAVLCSSSSATSADSCSGRTKSLSPRVWGPNRKDARRFWGHRRREALTLRRLAARS